jgi:hypothetical protein
VGQAGWLHCGTEQGSQHGFALMAQVLSGHLASPNGMSWYRAALTRDTPGLA